jgi:hypothetical protein
VRRALAFEPVSKTTRHRLASGASPHGTGWVQFFRELGDAAGAYKGPLFPTDDARPFNVPAFIGLLKSGLDVVPQRDYQLFPANGSDAKPDDDLPGSAVPYFLKADAGPRYFLAGQCCQPLATAVQTNGVFAMAWLEASSLLPLTPFGSRALRLRSAHTFLQVVDGAIDLVVGHRPVERLIAGEGAFIMAGDAFRLAYVAPYVRILVCSTGRRGGLEGVYLKAGRYHRGVKMIEKEVEVEAARVEEWLQEADAELA